MWSCSDTAKVDSSHLRPLHTVGRYVFLFWRTTRTTFTLNSPLFGHCFVSPVSETFAATTTTTATTPTTMNTTTVAKVTLGKRSVEQCVCAVAQQLPLLCWRFNHCYLLILPTDWTVLNLDWPHRAITSLKDGGSAWAQEVGPVMAMLHELNLYFSIHSVISSSFGTWALGSECEYRVSFIYLSLFFSLSTLCLHHLNWWMKLSNRCKKKQEPGISDPATVNKNR